MPYLRVETLTPQGEGLGRLAGRVVFVPGALAGETVETTLIESKKNWARGRLVRILEASPLRVTPPCPRFGACGGCQLQHLQTDAQDRLKQDSLQAVLSHGLGRDDPPLLPLVVSPRRTHYRHRIRLNWGKTGNRSKLGFYQSRSHRIIPIDGCLLADPALNAVIADIDRLVGGLPNPERPVNLEMQIHSPEDPAVMMYLPPPGPPRPLRTRLAEGIRELKSIRALFFQEQADGPLNGSEPFSPERHSFVYPIPLLPSSPSPGKLSLSCFPPVFSQVNLSQNQRLISWLLEQSLIRRGDTVWDLYCGQGNFTLPLSVVAGDCIGVEASAQAIENALWNQKHNNITACRFLRDRAAEGLIVLSRTGVRPDWVVLDPPRAGAREIIPVLSAIPRRGIVYISCEPATLVRDLRQFGELGWRPAWIQPFDFFPQTYHLESVSLLLK